MSSNSDSLAIEMKPDERRRRIAAILARGIMQYCRCSTLAEGGKSSPPRDTCLEVVAETRLSVSHGLTNETRTPD